MIESLFKLDGLIPKDPKAHFRLSFKMRQSINVSNFARKFGKNVWISII